MAGGRLLSPPRHQIGPVNAPPWLYGLGTVLAFLLLNLEITEYQFSSKLARDMTYSIGWALFGLGLLWVGISRRLGPARYASIGLLLVTLGKLFFYDLSQLDQLYRIGAFLGVAVILIAASMLYQRFLAHRPAAGPEKEKP